MIRAVVVGAGVMGRFHAAAIPAAGGSLAGVVDPAVERARAAGRGAPAFASISEAADALPAIDVVHVCTPLPTHVETVERALALGAHVIVEKPVAPSAEATGALLDAAAQRDRALVPVHQFLFQPGVRRILAAREALGGVTRVEFEAATAGADSTGLDPDELVADILPHPLALFARLTQTSPADLDWAVRRPARGELRALAEAGDGTLEIVVSTHARPTRARLGVAGTLASAEADLYHGFATIQSGRTTRVAKAARPFLLAATTLAAASGNAARRAAARELAYPGLRELIRLSYDAIAAGAPPPIAPWETLAVAAARDKLLG